MKPSIEGSGVFRGAVRIVLEVAGVKMLLLPDQTIC
jgi:ribosomal protein S5